MDMKAVNLFLALLTTLVLLSCKKETASQQIIPIPNGDLELWDNLPSLLYWQTNSCPVCDPPFETYIVQKVTDAYSGQFAAKFIYNNVYSSSANNKFSISSHPTMLSVYIKSKITSGDTVIISIDLLSGNIVVDFGYWHGTASTMNYEKIEIPISQNSTYADSAIIRITGGKKQNTELYTDNFILFGRNK
jgi:hypothetical protein